MKRLRLGAYKARLFILIISIISLCLSSGSLSQESFKMGFVNTQEVLENYKKAKDAEALLTAASERLKTKVGSLADEIRTLQEKKTKTALFVENAQIADLEQEILLKQQEYQREVDIGQQALLDKEQELMVPIFDEIRAVIGQIGESEGFDVIFEKRLITLYVDEKHDLTQRLIGLMNEDSK